MNPLRLLRVHPAVPALLALLALLTLSASLLVAGLPRVFEASYDRAVRQDMGDNPVEVTDLTVVLAPGGPQDWVTNVAALAEKDAAWRGALPPELRRVLADRAAAPGPGAHYGAKTYSTPLADRIGAEDRAMQYLNLAWLSGAGERVRYVAGSPPGPLGTMRRVPGYADLGAVPMFDVALVRGGAEKMGLDVGALLLLGNAPPVIARVTGLFEPVDATDRFWMHNQDMLRMSIRRSVAGDEQHLTGIIDGSGLARLRGYDGDLRYVWTLPVDGGAVNVRDAPALIDAIGRYRDQMAEQSPGPASRARFNLETGLDTVLARFLDRLRTARALMWLITGGLAVVALGVIALAVRLLTGRLGPALDLARARGGSLAQVTAAGVGVVALACGPAALLGYGLSFLIPGPATPPVHLGPPLLALAAIALAAGILAVAHRVPLHERRDDVVARRPSPRRLVVELLVVVLALAGAYLLRTRGLATGREAGAPGAQAPAVREADPFLVLVPAALTLAAALVTMRLYPYPLRLFVRLAARRRPAVPFLGLTMAARARTAAALPVLILLPALAVSVYGAVVTDALDTTQSLAAWRATGAAARIEHPSRIPADVVARVRRVPGVRAVVPAVKGRAQLGVLGQSAIVVAVDLAAYRGLLSEGPLTVPAPPRDAPAPAVPALVTPGLAPNASFDIGWYKRMTVVPRGVIEGGLPGLAPETGNLIVVPYGALARVGLDGFANVLLVGGDGLDRGRLRAAAGGPEALIVTAGDELDRIAGAPLTATIRSTLRIVTVALAAYAILAVIMTLVAGAAERARTLSFLRTLGLSEGQARSLTVLEVAPLVACAAVAGLLLGLALPTALGPGIDLSVYAGSLGVRDYPVGLAVPILLAAGLTAVAAVGAFAHAAAGRRRSLGSALRVGDIR